MPVLLAGFVMEGLPPTLLVNLVHVCINFLNVYKHLERVLLPVGIYIF